jgi:hypothetical protein
VVPLQGHFEEIESRVFWVKKELQKSEFEWVWPERSQDIYMPPAFLSGQTQTDIPIAVVSFGKKESISRQGRGLEH